MAEIAHEFSRSAVMATTTVEAFSMRSAGIGGIGIFSIAWVCKLQSFVGPSQISKPPLERIESSFASSSLGFASSDLQLDTTRSW
jgi:hypothetical protein